ncbi:uncharacterized protein LOC126747281 [Anthonomus grandis grandis]|uniref:uncharacterized protein LOC126747281 n=1 Tax=Anthonomus grandis grandis TaxID=2921223 RepID=UPI002165A7C3|nr:uncharacterized protein LOC126747281 [Anthonomus grandis grandis]
MEEMSSRFILCSWLLVTICRCHNVVPREVDTLTPGQMLEKEFGMNLEQRKKYFLELFDKGNEEAKKRMEVEKAEAKKKIPVVMDKFRADLEENGEWVFQEVEKYKKSENPDLTCISAHIKDISAVSLKISTDVHQCIEKNLMKE